MKVMLLPRSVIILHDAAIKPDVGRWYSAGLVDVDAYPELEPYCVPRDPIEVPCTTV